MQNKTIRILFIGDIVGSTGRDMIKGSVKRIREESNVDLVIANGENLAGGFGMTQKLMEQMTKAGIDVFTSGNHIWNNNDILNFISNKNILRPMNYHPDLPGNGYGTYQVNETEVVVINLEGRVFMNPLDCPFRTMDKILNEIGKNRIIFIDFHAEASAEKQALGLYLDGKVSAVVGTHTHVQTADERILPNGTAYITDAGMTGALNSVIGFNSSNSIERIILQIPKRLNISSDNPVINGVFIDIDTHTKKAVSIKRLFEHEKNIGQEHISEDN